MASNDMNLWDEDPDELLRQDWQQAFAGYKVQSRPALRQRILRRAMAHNRPKPMGWLAGGLLLVLISTVLIYTNHRSNHATSVQGHTTKVQPTSPGHSDRITARQPATLDRLAKSLKQADPGLRVSGSVGSRPLMDRQSIVTRTETADVDGSSRRTKLLSNRLRLGAESALPLADSYHADQPSTKPSHFSNTRLSVTLSPALDASHRERAEPLKENAGVGTDAPTIETYALVDEPVTPPVAFARLNTLALSSLPSSLRALPDRLPANESVAHSAGLADNRVRRGKQWFIETVPLSSFQWMSTSATSTDHLSQVNAPAAFSPATWGYQINGGIRWQHWQAYASVGQLRRWAYYTVNENQFHMDLDPTNSFQQVQERHVVAENVALPMVGGGLSQYRFLGQGRYTVELGGQVVYSLLDGQTLASLRGGASRRLPLSSRLDLQTGLLVEYGLTRLMSEQHQLTIHPLVVGVSVRLQPRQYSKERSRLVKSKY